MIIEASGSDASTSSGVANAAPPGNPDYDDDLIFPLDIISNH